MDNVEEPKLLEIKPSTREEIERNRAIYYGTRRLPPSYYIWWEVALPLKEWKNVWGLARNIKKMFDVESGHRKTTALKFGMWNRRLRKGDKVILRLYTVIGKVRQEYSWHNMNPNAYVMRIIRKIKYTINGNCAKYGFKVV